MKIYHQAGHRTKWNIDSYNEGVGDGIIISPVHMSIEQVDKKFEGILNRCLFDPQFYVPNSLKSNLNTYPFFPQEYERGFSTSDHEKAVFEEARMCIEYQMKTDFESLIIPARYFDDMWSDYIAKQKVFSVEPFLANLNRIESNKDVFLTIPLTESMILDDEYRTDILNWVTSYPEIDGIYLLVNFREKKKHIQDYSKLQGYKNFLKDCKSSELKIICSHVNTEGLLWSTLDVDIITIGAFENTRMFSIDKYLVSEEDRRGPAVRIYFPKLLNWMRLNTAKEIMQNYPDLWSLIYTPTQELDKYLKKTDQISFQNKEPYKSYFELIYDQYNILKENEPNDRKKVLQSWILQAHELYGALDETNILFHFDGNCRGDHLTIWNRLLSSL